ncbi:kinase-like domain-containing protein [Chlamydoabsidia padenii]|nr:kinase-like domain-containing protein [Chlamydoabsidia padenii]
MTYLARRTKQFATDTAKAASQYQQHKHSTSNSLRQKKDIGDYWLGKTIGRGASGRVKLGYHKHTGEKVAIKMIARSHLLSSTATAKSVQRELAVLQLLHHPHLVELKQVLQDSSYVYFVMEYLEGGELFQMLAEKGKFKESDAKSLFYQMVSGLAWCHAHYICHRDLKPENILLDKSKKWIKIADFGMAAMNTGLKTSCGSPHYASPEIVKGKAYDGTCTDVWSLGVILFALLSGHLPFDDENMGRLLGKIKSGKYRPLSNSLSSEARHLVKRMLVVEPHNRITMNEILCHPWLTSTSTPHLTLADPMNTWILEAPIINHSLDLEGHVWETLKVLWKDLRQEDIIHALASNGSNLQKLTCLLLQQRAKRIDQEEWKPNHHDSDSRYSSTTSVHRTYSVDETTIHSPAATNKTMHSRHESDDVGSKCSLATPYDSSISNVSCSRTIDMPSTPKNATFDLTMESNYYLKKKHWNRCDDASGFENVDPCMNHPQQQGNAPSSSSTALSFRSRWVYHQQQLILTCQQNEIISSNQPFSNTLVSDGNNICLTSFHANGDIQSNSELVSSTKCLPTTYNLMEQLNRQHSFAGTHKSSPSLSSVIQHWWPLTLVSTTTPDEPSTGWWSKTLDYVLQPWNKKKPNIITFDCHGKHECEVAGKIHQVLKEQLNGRLNGRVYPNNQIVWSGTFKSGASTTSLDEKQATQSASSRLWFLCQMVHQHGRHFKVNLVYLQGDMTYWNQGTDKLISTLTHYEQEATKVMVANGW